MKKTKYFLSLLLVATLTLTATACGNTNSTEPESVQESETEITPQEIDVTDLDPLADAGIITGVKDLKIAEDTEVDLNELVFVDDTIVTSVDINDSKVDYTKAGTYEVFYIIAFDGEALRDYLKENKLTVNFDTTEDTIIVKTVVTIEILTEAETEIALESGKTEVVTPETKADVQNSNKSQAVSTAKPSTSNNSSSSSSSSNKSSSGNNNSNSNGSNSSSSGSSNNSSGSATTHKHSYTSKVTKAATCGSTGIRTYTCSCGDSYTESIPATGNHSWKHYDATGHTEKVLVQDAYDETVYETHAFCKSCGEDFGSGDAGAEAAAYHGIITGHGSYESRRVPVSTTHHDAVYDEKWVQDSPAYDKCTVCGATK